MPSKAELLNQINQLVPPNVDWKSGAQRYVASMFEKMGRENVERFSMNKPFQIVGRDNPTPAITESVHYLNNFANALDLLKPANGARILDVACGGGWVSHYLSKMGYWTYGIDISADFVELAAQRLSSDVGLNVSAEAAARRFSVVDIETTPLPAELHGTFDFVWLESCLHHFVDPVSALENLTAALKPDGVLVLIEFENRKGSIKQEYLDVMKEYDTLERPYSRAELQSALGLAGLSHYEFFGTINGWYSATDPASSRVGERLLEGAADMNLAICTKDSGRLDDIFPHRKNRSPLSFGTGVSGENNGWRWCGPSSEIVATQSIEKVSIEIHSTLPPQLRREQVISVYGSKGEVTRMFLTPERAFAALSLGPIAKGESFTFHSADAFRPSWTGSPDDRLLSFYFKCEF
jgi:SAM-dependent methyltransferase